MLIGETTLDDLRNTVFVISLIITALGLIGIIVFSSSILKPIIILQGATRDISDGKLDTKININTNDEFQNLGESFSKMTKKLKKTIDTEVKLNLAKKELQNERLTSIGSLASRLAHDLRNPLTVIKSTMQILEINKTADKNELQKHHLRVEQAVDRMSHQIENVLDFIKLRPLTLKITPIFKIFDSAIDDVKIPSGIEIEKSGNDVIINCDEALIKVVFINFLINAIHAIGGKGEIKFNVTSKTNIILIEFEDSGPGIQEDEISKVFEPLYTTKQEGTGLGLSSCKSIIEQHGGTISVRNNPTTFSITLPKKLAE